MPLETKTFGLTGGIGSGKSAAAKRFAELGTGIVDADVVAREVVMPGEPCLDSITQHFGRSILLPNQTLDRRQLRDIIFHQPEQKRWLEQLLHPAIRQRILDQIAAKTSPYALLVSPLLLETSQHELVERIIVIDCSEDLQIARAQARDHTDGEQIRAIMATQMSRADRLARADDILHNHGDIADLNLQVDNLHNRYMAESR